MKELKFEDAVSYAMAFVSFAFSKLDEVKEIVLFGSVVRGEADSESDIDLFFDLTKKEHEEKIKNVLNDELKRFYKSNIFETWQLKGIKNSFGIHAGVLSEWKLKRSIISEGIIIYSRYKESPQNLKGFVYFGIEPVKNIAKRNKIMRKLFGRTEKNKTSKGIVEELNGKKFSSSVFVVPKEQAGKIIKILDSEKVRYKLFEFWTDQIL